MIDVADVLALVAEGQDTDAVDCHIMRRIGGAGVPTTKIKEFAELTRFHDTK